MLVFHVLSASSATASHVTLPSSRFEAGVPSCSCIVIGVDVHFCPLSVYACATEAHAARQRKRTARGMRPARLVKPPRDSITKKLRRPIGDAARTCVGKFRRTAVG